MFASETKQTRFLSFAFKLIAIVACLKLRKATLSGTLPSFISDKSAAVGLLWRI